MSALSTTNLVAKIFMADETKSDIKQILNNVAIMKFRIFIVLYFKVI